MPVSLWWSSSCEWCWSLDLLWWALRADTLTENRMTLYHTSRHWQMTHLFNKINNRNVKSVFQFTAGNLLRKRVLWQWLPEGCGLFPWNNNHKIHIYERNACLLTLYSSITRKRIQNAEQNLFRVNMFRWNMFHLNVVVNELFTSHVSFKHVSYLVLIYAVLLYLHKFLKRQLQNGAWNYCRSCVHSLRV